MTELEVKAPYITAHSELEKQYYKMGVISKEEFDLLHGRNWDDMRQELIAEGYLTEPEPPLVFEPSPGTGLPERLEYMEEFLRKLYPKEE